MGDAMTRHTAEKCIGIQGVASLPLQSEPSSMPSHCHVPHTHSGVGAASLREQAQVEATTKASGRCQLTLSRRSGTPCLLQNIAGKNLTAEADETVGQKQHGRAVSPRGRGRGINPSEARSGGSDEGAHSNLAALLLQLQLLAQPRIHLARLRSQQHASTYIPGDGCESLPQDLMCSAALFSAGDQSKPA